MSNEELAAAIQNGQEEYCEQLWAQVRKFIGQQAGQYMQSLSACRGITEDDLKQAGYFAVLDAAKAYNPEKGASFIHYLSFHLHRYFTETAGLRTDKTTADPINSAVSLDQPIDEDGATLADLEPDKRNAYEETEERIQQEQLRTVLDRAIDHLRPQDAEAIRLRYFDNMTMKAAAEKMKITPETLRQRQAHGLRELRRSPEKKALEAFLEAHTSYYSGPSFRITQTSPVEAIVLRREELRKKFERRLEEIKNLNGS